MLDITAALTLFLVMDAFGNAPIVAGLLDKVPAKRRVKVILRECLIALLILLVFLLVGPPLLGVMGIDPPALQVAGGVVLLLIALRMLFPTKGGPMGTIDDLDNEPLIVPIATPLIAGPSAIATVMLLHGDTPGELTRGLLTVLLAWSGTAAILCAAPLIVRLMGHRLTLAMERFMGMLLTVIAVQMMLAGIEAFIQGMRAS